MRELIAAAEAPSAGPYAPGLVIGDWIFLAGQGGFDLDTGELVSDNIAGQTAQVFPQRRDSAARGRSLARRRRLLPRAPA
jgi:enamine deaminase RidA (YjgF/YER057c/UK114 family)